MAFVFREFHLTWSQGDIKPLLNLFSSPSTSLLLFEHSCFSVQKVRTLKQMYDLVIYILSLLRGHWPKSDCPPTSPHPTPICGNAVVEVVVIIYANQCESCMPRKYPMVPVVQQEFLTCEYLLWRTKQRVPSADYNVGLRSFTMEWHFTVSVFHSYLHPNHISCVTQISV